MSQMSPEMLLTLARHELHDLLVQLEQADTARNHLPRRRRVERICHELEEMANAAGHEGVLRPRRARPEEFDGLTWSGPTE